MNLLRKFSIRNSSAHTYWAFNHFIMCIYVLNVFWHSNMQDSDPFFLQTNKTNMLAVCQKIAHIPRPEHAEFLWQCHMAILQTSNIENHPFMGKTHKNAWHLWKDPRNYRRPLLINAEYFWKCFPHKPPWLIEEAFNRCLKLSKLWYFHNEDKFWKCLH